MTYQQCLWVLVWICSLHSSRLSNFLWQEPRLSRSFHILDWSWTIAFFLNVHHSVVQSVLAFHIFHFYSDDVMPPVFLRDTCYTAGITTVIAVHRNVFIRMFRTTFIYLWRIMCSDNTSGPRLYFMTFKKPVSFVTCFACITKGSCTISTEPVDIEFWVTSGARNSCLSWWYKGGLFWTHISLKDCLLPLCSFLLRYIIDLVTVTQSGELVQFNLLIFV